MSKALVLLVMMLAGVASPQPEQRGQWRERWDATEFSIPMRDGVELYTVVYTPKGKPGPFPILMERTPYGAGSTERAPRRATPAITEAGYILAFQDVRGQGKSQGEFVNVRPTLKDGQSGIDESTDTWDSIEFLLKNVPGHNGAVGLWGISYPGFYAGAGAIRTHPALKAVSPQAPVNDWFLGDDVHHNGAFFLQETFDFMLFFDLPKGAEPIRLDREGKSAYQFFLDAGALSNYDPKLLQGRIPYWQELLANSTYNDYWKDRALWRAFHKVECAVLTVGGWFDKEDMWGALNLYKASERQNPGIPNYLVMGPWTHGGWAGPDGGKLGRLQFGSAVSGWYQANVELPFFERYLKGKTEVAPPAEATVFETGANQWRRFPAWPPAGLQQRALHLAANRSLAWAKPSSPSESSYLYDPARPTPYVADWERSRRAPGDWLARDQRFLQDRDDTVTYALPPLPSDLRVAGPVEADLWVSTTGTDCDLVVQLIDEYPAGTTDLDPEGQSMAGYQLMVRGEIMRAKFRDSFETPVAMKPGEPTRVRFKLNDVLHTFRKGHRILVRVQSAWFPVADRNPNTFIDIPRATDADFRAARISLHEGEDRASALRFGVLR